MSETIRTRKDPKDIALCANCGKPSAEGLRQCAGCKKVRYCGKECQKIHWKQHKPMCKGGNGEKSKK